MDVAALRRAGEPEFDGGWLCPTEADRIRLIEMSPAVRMSRLLITLFCGIGVFALAPMVGWGPVVVFAVATGPLIALDRGLARVRRPERLVAASLSLHTTLIAIGVSLTGGLRSPFLAWIAIPIVLGAARFRLVVFYVGAALAAGELALAAGVADPDAVVPTPAMMIAVAVLLAALVVSQRPLLASEVRWRREAVLDPLTGLLNRQGLEQRFAELAEQARLTGAALSMVMCDLDCFKRLNDRHGHARGDAVLREVAYLMRKSLRSFELLYRIGGEELLLILPGAELDESCAIADSLREAIETAQPAGLPVTASFGVHTATGIDIEFDAMFQASDLALYAAKQSGRNRIAISDPDVPAPVILTQRNPHLAAT